jgi:uncharacterized membrane protein HdeD (DUF308 family)
MSNASAILLQSVFALVATVYLLSRASLDWRAGNRKLAAIGLVIAVLGLISLFNPIRTAAFVIDTTSN